MSERTVRRYVVDSSAMRMDVENRITRLKEWAVVKDLGVIFSSFPSRTCWEVWVAGELKDTVFREGDAEEELRKYLSGEYT